MKKKSIFISIFYKKHISVVIISLLGAVALVFVFSNFLMSLRSQEATLSLAFENNGQGRMFAGRVVGDMTILDALITSSYAGQIKFNYTVDASNKAKILRLDGYYDESSQKKLLFYLNGKIVEENNIHLVNIKPGDYIEVNLR